MDASPGDRPSSSTVAVHAGRHADDPIIYFTLVDFLVQLLFFGLFLFVVFRFGGGNEDEEQRWVKKSDWAIFESLRANLPFYKGMSELVAADSQEAMLKALQELRKQGLLEDFLRFASQTDSPLEVIQYCAKQPAVCRRLVGQCEKHPEACSRFAAADAQGVGRMLGALGLPPCREDKQSLFSIIGYGSGRPGEAGHFKVREIYPAGMETLGAAGIRLSGGQDLTKGQVQTVFRAVSTGSLRCAHYVDYVAETDSELMRAILAESFYLRTKVLENGVLKDRRVPRQ
jgi:hypothetical protein